MAETGDGQLLEGAQLNSTLHLKAALEKVTLEEFDPQKAMKEKLQTSTHTKNQISAKSAECNSPTLIIYTHTHTHTHTHRHRHRSVCCRTCCCAGCGIMARCTGGDRGVLFHR